MKTAFAAIALTFAIGTAQSALAADHEVKMLNRGSNGQMMVFEPAFLKIAPGDSVTFLPTDMGHNAETIPGVLPDGAVEVVGKMNKAVTMTFDVEGVYGIRCKPHYAMGMVGVIQVGEALTNLEAAKATRYPGKAKQRTADLMSQISGGPAGAAAGAGE